jgi:hypothetical protein
LAAGKKTSRGKGSLQDFHLPAICKQAHPDLADTAAGVINRHTDGARGADKRRFEPDVQCRCRAFHSDDGQPYGGDADQQHTMMTRIGLSELPFLFNAIPFHADR